MAVSPPPRKSASSSESAARRQPDNKQIEAIINRGSSAVAPSAAATPLPLKNFNVKLPATMLTQIDEVRAQRPRKPTSPKLGISTQDWLLEAVTEKLEREQKKYKLR